MQRRGVEEGVRGGGRGCGGPLHLRAASRRPELQRQAGETARVHEEDRSAVRKHEVTSASVIVVDNDVVVVLVSVGGEDSAHVGG